MLAICRVLFPSALLMPALTLAVDIASTGVPMGQLEVRVTDHKPGIDQFSSLDVTLEAVALHEKGARRRDGWIDIVGQTEAIDIVPLKDGRFVSLGMQDVPTGDYDAIAVRFAAVEGQLKAKGEPIVWLDDAIVRIDIAITEQDNTPLVLDLYAEDQTEHEVPRYEVKVKEVRLGE